MLKKNAVWWVLTLSLLGGAFAAEAAEAPDVPDVPVAPLPLYPGATVRSSAFTLYEHLDLKLTSEQGGNGTLQVSGNLWEMWVTSSAENETLKAHYHDLATRQGAVLADAGTNDLHFRYDHADGPVYVNFHAQGGKYALDILRPAPPHSQVVFGDGQYADREADPGTDRPEPPLITDYPDSRCTSFTYNAFNSLDLKYEVEGKAVTTSAEGRYWQKRIQMNDAAGRPRTWVSPTDINATMRAAVLAAGGDVLSGDNRELVFRLENEDVGRLWAKIWPQDGKYSLEVIQETAMEQVLVFDADAMMARLDALGVLTLDGIFFDTAQATLKPESDLALEAALKLMTDYPDLVLEVGGHTDNVGQPAANEKLSNDRALSVGAWLVDAGIEPARLEAQGYGEGSPVADNNTEVGRATNRRVELKKLAGGEVREVMSLIKPYPGSEAAGQDEKSAEYELLVYENDANGGSRKRTVTGSGFRQHYLVQDEAGQKDTQLSGLQIRHNYITAVQDFGGTILAEVSHGLYFRLDNLDGSSTFVAVWAPGAKYHVTAVTVPSP